MVLNLVPGLGLCLVLTGSRPHYVDERFMEATDDLDVYPFEVPQDVSPAAKFAKGASTDVAHRIAERLGAPLVIDPGKALADILRPVDEVVILHAPAPPFDEAVRFDSESLTWKSEHRQKPGLYRVDLHGRPVHRRLDDYGHWWDIDLAAGQFLAVAGSRHPVIRWRPPLPNSTRPAALEVRTEMSLPVLAERAACVSSGLEPSHHRQWTRFLNVPRDLAETLAHRLKQELQTVWEEDD